MIEIGTSPTVESRQSTTDQLSQVDKLRASLHQVPRGGARPDPKPHAPPLFLKRPIFDKSGRFRVYETCRLPPSLCGERSRRL